MDLLGPGDIEKALQLVGELLASGGHEYAIVVVGGAAMNMLGVVERSTADVDIVAFARARANGKPSADSIEAPPEPMPEALRGAAHTVASDLGLDENWLNTESALQWRAGLPRGISRRIQWSRYSGLWVGVIDRYDLIFFKLFAAADSTGPRSKHYRDLVALHPTARELQDAAKWVETQDASPEFGAILTKVVAHASKDLGIA